MPYPIRAELEIKSWNAKIVHQHYAKGLKAAFEKWGDDVVAQAKENVAPGKGPSVHPHKWSYEDTGHLQENIEKLVDDGPNGPVMLIGTDVPYGNWLELGWHQAGTAKFYRYPWLQPAIDSQAKRLNLYLLEIKG